MSEKNNEVKTDGDGSNFSSLTSNDTPLNTVKNISENALILNEIRLLRHDFDRFSNYMKNKDRESLAREREKRF